MQSEIPRAIIRRAGYQGPVPIAIEWMSNSRIPLCDSVLGKPIKITNDLEIYLKWSNASPGITSGSIKVTQISMTFLVQTERLYVLGKGSGNIER